MRKLKLIWDFRGPYAEKTAEHYELHLKDYLKVEEVFFAETGCTKINDMHSIAFIIINENDMRKVRDDLKPHRGELYEE
ncbi:hypothetical protein [Abyssalbus ytuae]|uniref:Uncharacterized protein n=1 Tax=Abyssalbus ytuae TaxID=2926907 RepID=A0A9E6ZPV6_9FLAO|nr:hypothetical protein [Abyssalbus ytuae]UOB18305.1 hypothetical protein MQE35_03215 [Abyssalbus ytuae]